MSYNRQNPNGQATMANSEPVVIASDQSAVPVSGTVTVQQSTAANLKVDLSGTAANATAIKVDGSAVTQPVSASSLPLPTGAATSANQTTANTTLSSINAKVPSLGQATMANSTPVTIASDQTGMAVSGTVTVQQSTAANLKVDLSGTAANATAIKVDGSTVTQPVSASSLPLPSGAATSANQTTANTSLSSIDSKITTVNTGAVVVSSSALPTGAATSANQSTANTSLSSIDTKTPALGQTTMSGSTPVTIASNQSAVPVSGTVTANMGTVNGLALDATLTGGTQQTKLTDGTNVANMLKSDGTAAGQNAQMVAGSHLAVSFTTTTAQAVASTDAANYSWVSVHIVTQGTSSTITFQCSNDNTNWVSLGLGVSTNAASSTNIGTSTTSAGIIAYGSLPARYFRLNVTGISAGTTAGVVEFFTQPKGSQIINTAAAQSGTWTVQPGNTANTTPWLVTASGDVASGSSDSGNPLKQGAVARTTSPTAVTDGQRVNLIADKVGKQVVVGSVRDLKGAQYTSIVSSTSETTIVTAVASTFLDLYGLILTNTSASATKVTIKDATAGTTRIIIMVPPLETRGFMLPESAAHTQSAVNNNWTATCGTSVANLEVTAFFVKNI